MRNVLISWKKEIRAIFRDKKYLMIILFMPLIIPGFIMAMGELYDSIEAQDEYKIGINYTMSDSEKDMLKNISDKIEIKQDQTSKLEEEYNNDNIDGYIVKENNTYYLYLDTSETKGMSLASLLNTYFEQYNKYLGLNYLTENNINPDNVYNNVKVELKELAKEGTSFFTNYIISFALIYLVMIIVIAAMNTSTDIIAGEKERGTFETLLTFPLTSNEIIGGKLLAIVTSCIISSLIGVATSIPAFVFIKNNTDTFKDMTMNINVSTILLTIITLILISCLVGVLSIFLCGKAKTFKEAQSKVSFLSFVSLIPMFTSIADVSSTILYIIPIANGGQILNDIFLNGIDYVNFGLFICSSVIFTFALLFIVSKQYKDEKALF